jgi:hypothetical protein
LIAWNAQNDGAAVILVANDKIEPLIIMDILEEENVDAAYLHILDWAKSFQHLDELRSHKPGKEELGPAPQSVHFSGYFVADDGGVIQDDKTIFLNQNVEQLLNKGK